MNLFVCNPILSTKQAFMCKYNLKLNSHKNFGLLATRDCEIM